jgi:mannose-6-phosphate isomerase-like protein (cupin superfamily)
MIVRRESIVPFDFEGLLIRDYTAGMAGRSSLAVIEVPPDVHHREASSSRSDKYYYVAEGRVSFQIDGEPHELETGDFCLVRQGQRFSYGNRSRQTAVLVLVHTPPYDEASETFVE